MKRIKAKGFSLLELLLVFVIIAALVITAFFVFDKVKDSRAVESEAKNIAAIKSQVSSLYAGTVNYKGLQQNGLNSKQLVAQLNGGTSKNFWGGDITISSSKVNGKTMVRIDYGQIPKEREICIRLVTQTYSIFDRVEVNSTVVYNKGVKPIDVRAAAIACNKGSGKNADKVSKIAYFF